MTDADLSQAEWVVEDEPKPVPVDGRDWLLQEVVALVNAGAKLPITLAIGGFLVSGRLISARDYLEAMAQLMLEEGRGSEDVAKVLADFWRGKLAVYDELERIAREEPDDPRTAPGFIHLEEAQFFGVGGLPIPAKGSVLWRGKIADVAGFNWGRLGASESG